MKLFKNSQGKWDWSKISLPVITLITIPLICLAYNNLVKADASKANKAVTAAEIAHLKSAVKAKMNTELILQYIKSSQQQAEYLRKQVESNERRDVRQQQKDDEMQKTLGELNTTIKLLEQKLQ